MARFVEGMPGELPWADARADPQPGPNGRRAGARIGQEVPDDPLPCDGCAWERACADGLACDTFVTWASTGRVGRDVERVPTGDTYRRVFRGQPSR